MKAEENIHTFVGWERLECEDLRSKGTKRYPSDRGFLLSLPGPSGQVLQPKAKRR